MRVTGSRVIDLEEQETQGLQGAKVGLKGVMIAIEFSFDSIVARAWRKRS